MQASFPPLSNPAHIILSVRSKFMMLAQCCESMTGTSSCCKSLVVAPACSSGIPQPTTFAHKSVNSFLSPGFSKQIGVASIALKSKDFFNLRIEISKKIYIHKFTSSKLRTNAPLYYFFHLLEQRYVIIVPGNFKEKFLRFSKCI
jgi:hypothetical protein